jgi:hypothetical protein
MKKIKHWNKAVVEMIEGYIREEDQIQFRLDDMFMGWDDFDSQAVDPRIEREMRNRLDVIRALRDAAEAQLLDFVVTQDYKAAVEVRAA